MTTDTPTTLVAEGARGVRARRGKLDVEGVSHAFGAHAALRDITLHVPDGEFVTLLGPSGCGKTTLLRIIAGFIRPSSGRVLLEDEDVTRTRPSERCTQMVFQRPTLFPHLDVAENIAFGLRVAKLPASEIRRKVAWALELVRLTSFARRRAHELSGGQMQRIAMARAIVLDPKVLLLDEPLSALDLKIRLEMESELRRLHRETGATFVYVTHDQREALALSDRIVVFNEGRIEQAGSAEEIYRRPISAFAARFVGDANVVPVVVEAVEGSVATVVVAGRRLSVPREHAVARGPAELVIRQEDVVLCEEQDGALAGTLIDVAFRGTGFTCEVLVDGLDASVKAEVRAAGMAHLPRIGDRVALTWPPGGCTLLAADESDAPARGGGRGGEGEQR